MAVHKIEMLVHISGEKPRRMVCLRARKIVENEFTMPPSEIWENVNEKRKTGMYV